MERLPIMNSIDLNTDLSSLSFDSYSPNVPLCSGVYKIANMLSINQLNEKIFIGQKDNSNQPLTTIALHTSVRVSSDLDGICQITIDENHFPVLYRDDVACLMQKTEIREIRVFSITSQVELNNKFFYQTCEEWVYDHSKVDSFLIIYTEFKTLKFFVVDKSNVNGTKSVQLRSSAEANINKIAGGYVKLCIYNPLIDDSDIEEDHYIFSSDTNEQETIIKYRKPSNMTVLPSFSVPTNETLLSISQSSNITFRNIRFIGNAFNDPTRCQDQADFLAPNAIHINRGCSDITFENCVFEHLHGYCIGVGDTENDSRQPSGMVVTDDDCDCRGIYITGCTFQNIYGGAIHFNNCSSSTNNDSTISNNTITGYGNLLASACAILMRSGFGVQITGNTISNGYYTGISVGWDWNYTRPGQCHDNTIAYNTITNVLRSTTFLDNNDNGILMYDGGGIYTLGISHGTVIHHNVIHSVCQDHKADNFRSFIGPHDMRWNLSAIYLDEASSFIKVYENVVYNNPVNVHIHHGNGLELFDNLFAYPTICNLIANYNHRYFAPKIIDNNTIQHPYTTGNHEKIIVEDVMFFSYRNIYIQEEGRVFRLPFREECYFTGDMFDVYGSNVHRGSLSDVINDTTRADGCFESAIHSVLFNYCNQTRQWELIDNLENFPVAYYECYARQYYRNNEEMNRIRVSCPYWYGKLCFLVKVRRQTKLRMDAGFRYLDCSDPMTNWLTSDASHKITLAADKEYIICAENYYDGYVTFDDITNLKVFDVTIVNQIQEFHTSGNYFEYAYLSCHDLHKLRYVEHLLVRYGLRDLSDRSMVSLAQFKSLSILLLGGAQIYTEDSHYGGMADRHIRRLFIPDSIMAQLEELNIGVEYVPHNLGALRNCANLYLFGSPVWKYLADKVVETDDPQTRNSTIGFREEYTPGPISVFYLSANSYFDEFIYLKDLFATVCTHSNS